MNRKVYVDKSKTGRGLFAARNIRKGEVLFRFTGKVVKFDSYTRLQIGPGRWVEPGKATCRWINHSCYPNAGIRGSRTFVAIKPIRKGKEVTYDYSTSEDAPMRQPYIRGCRCGSRNCRRNIWGWSRLPERLKRKYARFTSAWLKKRAAAANGA